MERKKTLFSLVLLAASLMLIALGVSRGEMAVVLQKAVNLCMECIGIG